MRVDIYIVRRTNGGVVIRTPHIFRDRISKWSDLTELVDHFSYYNGRDWLFRGVTDAAHGLIPKIGRKTARKSKKRKGSSKREHVPYRPNDERAVLAMFRQQARAYLSSQPTSDLEWLAIAQHYGLPTRLLDWTDSLFVAAWFAVEKGRAQDVNAALWVTERVPFVALDYSGDPLDLHEPKVYRPPHVSPRISAQGSVLMICAEPREELVLPFCRQIVINKSVNFTIKKRLNACGINRRHLFPDLAGLTEHLTWMYKNDWLAGYKLESDSQPTPFHNHTSDEAGE